MKKILVVALYLALNVGAPVLSFADQAPAVPADVPVTQAPAAAAATPGFAQQPAGGIGMILPLVVMFGLFYLLIIMPQNKRMKEQKKMQTEIAVGDDVLLNSGLMGKIVGVAEHFFTVEFEAGARARVVKNAVIRKGKNLHEASAA